MREEAALALIQTLVGVPRQLCRVLSHVHFTSCVRMIYSGRIMWRYRNRAWGGVGDGVSAGPGAHRGPRRGFEVDSGSVRQSHSRSINSLQRNLKRRRELASSPPLLSPSLCLSTFVCFNFVCPSSSLGFMFESLLQPGFIFISVFMYWHKAERAAVFTVSTLMKACVYVPKDFM